MLFPIPSAIASILSALSLLERSQSRAADAAIYVIGNAAYFAGVSAYAIYTAVRWAAFVLFLTNIATVPNTVASEIGLLPEACLSLAPAFIDLGPELSNEALLVNLDRVLKPAIQESITPTVAHVTTAELSKLTVKQLQAMARERQLPRYSRMRKAELTAALAEA